MSDVSAGAGPGMRGAWGTRLALVGTALAAGILLHHFLALSLQSPPGPDEGMYLSAAALSREQAIYSGYSYPQAPYLPLVVSRALLAFDQTSPLLVGRIATWTHHVAALVVLFLIANTYTRAFLFSFLFVIFLALQGFALFGGATLHNSTFANTYALLAFLLLLKGVANARRISLVLSGVSLATSIGMKLTHAPLLVAFLLPHLSRQNRRVLGPLVFGLAAGAVPMLVLAARAPEAFWFNNLGWHRAAMADVTGSFHAVARDLLATFSDVTWAGPLTLLTAYVVADWRWRKEPKSALPNDRLLLLLVPLVYTVAVIGFGQVRYWYLEPALYLGGLLVPSLCADQPISQRRVTGAALLSMTAALFLLRTPSIVSTPSALKREPWIASRLEEGAERARVAVEEGGGGTAVVALGEMPQIYAVEARLPLHASTPSGAFECANARMPDEDRRRFHLATFEDAALMMERGTLAAMVVRSPDCADGQNPRSRCDTAPCDVLRKLDATARKAILGADDGDLDAVLYTRPSQ